jgi:hypothetical protein
MRHDGTVEWNGDYGSRTEAEHHDPGGRRCLSGESSQTWEGQVHRVMAGKYSNHDAFRVPVTRGKWTRCVLWTNQNAN